MDPTAPDNNDQNPQNPQVPQSPIQPGQYVVASQDNLAGQNQVQNPTIPAPDPSFNTANTAQAPSPYQAPVGPPPVDPSAPLGYTGNNFQTPPFNSQMPAGNPPQPNPAPFTPPIAPGTQEQSPGDDSKSKMIKIAGIILGVLALLAIIGGLVWFFVINKGSNETVSTTQQNVIEEPSPAVQNPQAGFNQIPQATDQASPQNSAPPSTDGQPAQGSSTPTPPAQ